MRGGQGSLWTFINLIVFIGLSTVFLSCSSSEKKTKIEITSCLVRDRVILLDTIRMRSMIIVAFKTLPKFKNLANLTISGELYHNESLISKDKILYLDASGNNLGFDIPLSKGEFICEKPYGIPDGKYLIVIKLFDQNHLIAQAEKELERSQIGRTFYGFDKVYEQPQYILINDEKTNGGSLRLRLEATDQQTDEGSLRSRLEAKDKKTNNDKQKAKDYIVFQKSYLERVYPNTKLEEHEMIREISTELARNETKPLTFSIRAYKDLRRVKISITPFKDKQGSPSKIHVQVGAVNQLSEVVTKDDEKNVVYYQYAPKIIEDKEVIVPQHHTQTYWLTFKANSETKPGDYYGSIKIMPQSGKQTEIPVHVKVLPLELTDTDKQYGMMMDYALYELDNDVWTEKEKKLIQKRGMEIYEDLRDHGMTLIYPHSHFYYKVDKNGEPILNSLRASLESYKNLKFHGPFVWYLGHLLQTAKPKHPGSILNYDAEVAKRRLQDLLEIFETIARELSITKDKLVVQLVDEPDREDKERVNAGKELHAIARKMGFKTMITRAWPDVDIICTGIPKNEEEAERLKKMGKEWWIYPNNTLNSKNLAYTRYVFGFGAWHWGIDGVSPWTFQMSQGSNGNPFTILDGPEIMVAYPGVNGPIPTPTWEAIRDGINDYKYIYLLKKMISAGKVRSDPVALRIEQQLSLLKNNLGKSPGPKEGEFGDWQPELFEKKRKQIVEWAMELQQKPKKVGESLRLRITSFEEKRKGLRTELLIR
jgi:hypothetical protein